MDTKTNLCLSESLLQSDSEEVEIRLCVIKSNYKNWQETSVGEGTYFSTNKHTQMSPTSRIIIEMICLHSFLSLIPHNTL